MVKEEMTTDLKALGMEFPVVVKTCCGGSSVGVYIVNDQAEYEQALKDAYSYENEVVVEEYIKGREFSVAVVDGKAYPIIAIAPLQGFYDYKNKYSAGATKETCPAKVDEETSQRMQRWAEKACEAAGIKAFARVDELMNEDGQIFCLEINTLPGMTATSLVPQEAQVVGISYDDVTQKLVELSLAKYE